MPLERAVQADSVEDVNLEPYIWSQQDRKLHDLTIAGYTIKLPKNKQDLITWGKLHRHAIGAYNFTTDTKLFSVWKEDNLISCLQYSDTLDCSNVSGKYVLIQHRGRYNAKPSLPLSIYKEIEETIADCLNDAGFL